MSWRFELRAGLAPGWGPWRGLGCGGESLQVGRAVGVRRGRRWLATLCAGALLGLVGGALAQSPATPGAQVHPSRQGEVRAMARFDATTWGRLLAQGPRPAAYVFSTTHCPTCPLAFESLHDAVRTSGQRVELAAVVMDAQGPQALAHLRHYSGVTRAYAFDGFEPEIRHSVDPKWRNITPYVVLVDAKGQLQRFTGQPQASQLQAWLGL